MNCKDIIIGIVVGHSESSQGAINYKGETEYTFNSRIAKKVNIAMYERGIQVPILFRPANKHYTDQCGAIAHQIEQLELHYSLHLHFNSHISKISGCECLVLHGNRGEQLADMITDEINQRLGIRERGNDGVQVINNTHNGYGMLKAVKAKGCTGAIIEPAFNLERAFFEYEDIYVDILCDIITGCYLITNADKNFDIDFDVHC